MNNEKIYLVAVEYTEVKPKVFLEKNTKIGRKLAKDFLSKNKDIKIVKCKIIIKI